MKKLFNKITTYKEYSYIEKNGDLSPEHYIQVQDKKIEVTDTNGTKSGKNIAIWSIYELDKDILAELNEYMIKVNSTNATFEKEYVNNKFSSFKIGKFIAIDFRGCKTKKNKKDKINRTVEEVTDIYDRNINLWLVSRIDNINSRINDWVNVQNKRYSDEITHVLTKGDELYQDVLSEDADYVKMDTEYKEVVSKYEAIKKQKEGLENKITQRKRDVVIGYFEENDWKVDFDDDTEKDVVPKPLVEHIKDALSKAFVFSKGLFD
jgi:molybdopterin converting factor small subunit